MTFSKISNSSVSIVFLMLLLLSFNGQAQPSAQEVNTAMGRGINLGNTLEPDLEGAWNNGPVQEYYFDDYKAAGFTSIRIPVRWDKHTANTSPYTVEEAWMDRIEQVIDWGLQRDLYIVLNTHHDDWLKTDYANPILRDRFDSIWNQIAIRFQNKSFQLLFEMINEPNGIELDEINELNARVLSIIRKTNPTRIVLFGGHRWANSAELLAADIPDDPYLIGYFHSYDPWSFAGEAIGTWGTSSDLNSLKSKFNSVQKWSEENNIPVTLNEFGAINECDYNSRMYHYASYIEEALKHNFSFNAWDDGGDFRIYQREQRDWNEIKDILIYTSSTSPTKLKLTSEQDSSLLLTWSTRSDSLSSITIERKTETGSFTEIATLLNDKISYNDFDIDFNTNYYYRVIDHYEYSNDIPSYPITGFFDPSSIKVGIDPLILKNDLQISSNQPNTVLLINNSNFKGSISFYNLNGALLSNELIVNQNNEYHLNEKGIILYQIIMEKGEYKKGKILMK